MTLDDETASDGLILENPLLVPLEPSQMDLLELIAYPLGGYGDRWPIWDYVARQTGRTSPTFVDADAILRSLPSVRTDEWSFRRRYGLVWAMDTNDDRPQPQHRVGLTVAGLVQLSRRRPLARMFADGIADIIARLANEEKQLLADPYKLAETKVELAFVSSFFRPTRQHPGSIGINTVLDVLEREYPPIQVVSRDSAPYTNLSPGVRPFSGLTGANAYLEVINAKSAELRGAPANSAATLPLMLDYVSHVFAGLGPKWGAGALLRIPDLRTAGSIGEIVQTEDEFKSHISALAVVLAELNVPAPPKEVLDEKYPDAKPGSLVKLKEWVHSAIVDETDREIALSAIEDLRSIIAIRNYAQHPSHATRTRASRAMLRLGIADPILNWYDSWEIIRARAADAFDRLRASASNADLS